VYLFASGSRKDLVQPSLQVVLHSLTC
jgi:hypothetical protein